MDRFRVLQGWAQKIHSLSSSVVVSPPLKNISPNGNLPQIGVKIKDHSNHHLGRVKYNSTYVGVSYNPRVKPIYVQPFILYRVYNL